MIDGTIGIVQDPLSSWILQSVARLKLPQSLPGNITARRKRDIISSMKWDVLLEFPESVGGMDHTNQ
jgi:hypothetical protein